MYQLIVPYPYLEIVPLLVSCRGYIFGGAIRDFIRGVEPADIDVSVRDYETFYSGLTALGYVSSETDVTGITMIKGNVIVQVQELNDPDIIVDINVAPDFDINMLAWDGEAIFNYQNPTFDVASTLSHIDTMCAEKIYPTEERIQKMKNKGYTILENTYL